MYVDPTGESIDSVCKGFEFLKEVFEKFPGFVQNTKIFITNFGNRIPDFLNDSVIGEIKNVAYQTLTKQIRGFIQIAQQQGKTFVLVINQSTILSKPLLKAIEQVGGIIVRAGSKINITPLIVNDETLQWFLRNGITGIDNIN